MVEQQDQQQQPTTTIMSDDNNNNNNGIVGSTPKQHDDVVAEGNVVDNNKSDFNSVPSDIMEYKAKLEKETGKKLKLRYEHDVPSVPYLLKYGTEESNANKSTWKELYLYPILFALFFTICLAIFHYTVMIHPPTRIPFHQRTKLGALASIASQTAAAQQQQYNIPPIDNTNNINIMKKKEEL